MQREFFSEPDVLENPDETNERAQRVLSHFLDRSEGKYSKEMETVMEKIDFKKLKEIFLEIAQRCGIDEKDLNFLEKDRIFGISGGFYGGTYDRDSNLILLEEIDGQVSFDITKKSQVEIDKENRERIKKDYGSETIYDLARLIHEECHAVSKNTCRGKMQTGTGENKKEFFLYGQSGYHRDQRRGPELFFGKEFYHVFHALNEGVVEKLAREITFRYLQESDWSKEEINVFKKSLEQVPENHAYWQEVQLVNLIVEKIAREIKQSNNVAWEPFIRGLLKGEKFQEEQTQELFSRIFGPNFIQELADISALFFSGNKEKLEKLKIKYGLET